jgi:hypothetical protein
MRNWRPDEKLIFSVTRRNSNCAASTPIAWANSTGMHDDLVEHLTGSWKMGGQVMGRDAHHELKAPFYTTFQWSPDSGGGWQWLMEQKGKDGKWANFGDFNITRSAQ